MPASAVDTMVTEYSCVEGQTSTTVSSAHLPCTAMPVSDVVTVATESSLEAQTSTIESSAQLPCTAMPDYDSANNTDSDYVPGY